MCSFVSLVFSFLSFFLRVRSDPTGKTGEVPGPVQKRRKEKGLPQPKKRGKERPGHRKISKV